MTQTELEPHSLALLRLMLFPCIHDLIPENYSDIFLRALSKPFNLFVPHNAKNANTMKQNFCLMVPKVFVSRIVLIGSGCSQGLFVVSISDSASCRSQNIVHPIEWWFVQRFRYGMWKFQLGLIINIGK